MKDEAYKRHDISDEIWAILEPLLPGQRGKHGGIAKDNRLFINAVFWIFRTGVPWRDLPPSYGDWKNTHRRFSRWRDKGIWQNIFEELAQHSEYEWLMSRLCKSDLRAAGIGVCAWFCDFYLQVFRDFVPVFLQILTYETS